MMRFDSMFVHIIGSMLLLLAFVALGTHSQQIPDHLIHCYRGSATQPLLPHTVQLLVELIGKIEDAEQTTIDMRRLSANLMHRLRVDGIERAVSIGESEFVTPYRANGVQVPKYQLLLQLISDIPAPYPFDHFLSAGELCHLHRMLSASVEPFERGDESRSCPLTMQTPDRIASPWLKWNKIQDPFSAATIVNTERASRCPLELGTVRSQAYGTFTPGTIIASLAAGMQTQRVQISEFFRPREYETRLEGGAMKRRETTNGPALSSLIRSLDTVDNVYASGLSGDLAEVCVYQGPYVGTDVMVGLAGTWNNTLYPQMSFLREAHFVRWEMTDAEILAGIDGIFLAQQISGWVHRVRRIRLSQIIDMYYSNRGIPTTGIDALPLTPNVGGSVGRRRIERRSDSLATAPDYHHPMARFSNRDDLTSACNRRKILELIDREALHDEVYNMAQVLQFQRSSLAVSDQTLRTNCDATVRRFFEYAADLLAALPSCAHIAEENATPVLDLTVVLDGARAEYESLELIAYIAEMVQVSNYGSSISVINGQTGRYLVRRTHSVASAFEQMRNASDPYPTALSLSRSLQSLTLTLSNQTRTERQNLQVAANSHLLLVFAQKERVNQLDFESASRIIHGALHEFPDLYYTFVTSSPDQFEELTVESGPPQTTRFDRLRHAEHFKIIRANELSARTFGTELQQHLKTVPRRIMSPFCRNNSADYADDRDAGRFVFHEDYVSPNVEQRYRIASQFLVGVDRVEVRFQVNYGKVTVCMSRDLLNAPLQCYSIGESGVAEFIIGQPCPSTFECPGIFFTVTLDQSLMRCLENRCRYPDQVLLIMRHSGLRCVADDRSSADHHMPEFGFQTIMAVLVVVFMTCFRV